MNSLEIKTGQTVILYTEKKVIYKRTAKEDFSFSTPTLYFIGTVEEVENKIKELNIIDAPFTDKLIKI